MCKRLILFLITTTVVPPIFIGFFFSKKFLIRNACGIESLIADIALILLWKKKKGLKTF
jgi:hypothetical protein